MKKTLAIFGCVLLATVCLHSTARAGSNSSAGIALSVVSAGGDTLAYEVVASGTQDVTVVHLEFSFDDEVLEFASWEDSDVVGNRSLRIGPRLEDSGTVLVAIYSPEFRTRNSFDVGTVRLVRQAGSNALPGIHRASLTGQDYAEDWVVLPGEGGGQAPPAPAVEENLPVRFSLRSLSPNPMIRNTTVSFEIPRPGAHVIIKMFDVTGRVARTLIDEHRAPGYYSETWDLNNDHGERVAPGVYFCRMAAGDFIDTRKVVLLQ